MPSLKWSVVKSVPGYLNISKMCLLCLHKKFETFNYPNQEGLLNKRSECLEIIKKNDNIPAIIITIYNSNL